MSAKSETRKALAVFDPAVIIEAAVESVKKLAPNRLMRNPVIFVTEVVAALVTVLWLRDLVRGTGSPFFSGQIAAWLWFTVLFATFAEAIAEGRGKAQAATLRATRSDTMAKRLIDPTGRNHLAAVTENVNALSLRLGDVVLVEAGEIIPSDGEIIEGVASVNESAITGESAPVIREAGGDRSAVTGGTTVLSDWVKVRITAQPGETFIDRMIALVEGAERQKTPNELALSVLLAGLTLIFLIAVVTLYGLAVYSGAVPSVVVLVALLVTLIPTTIGGLLSAIGIAGMDRLVRFNVLATSGRAVEAAGDVDTLLLDKTGTITFGNRMATEFLTLPGIDPRRLAEAALLASLADETPEGRSIVALAKSEYGIGEPDLSRDHPVVIPFAAQTRLSGVDLDERRLRKGAVDSVLKFAGFSPERAPSAFRAAVDRISRAGGTPLAVAEFLTQAAPAHAVGAQAVATESGTLLGVIALSDVVKPGIKERFAALRAMGIKTVMITGDNPLTAAAIATQAGVDDFLAEATPEDKLKFIRKEQTGGRLVAMCGDGTNDAPALAQADVGVAMQTGTQAAREAGNMVDLDSDPTKLIEVVEIGKQLLMTRGSLTTFSIANDVAKYFAILPALFVATYPELGALNVMHLASPQSAILSAVIFNALIIVTLIPLALKGVKYRAVGAAALLRRNLLVYGLGGLLAPFIGIKLIDLAVAALHLA
jgi:K+-transporting ATPase ATPase B chain